MKTADSEKINQHIGVIIKNSSELNELEFKLGYNLSENTYIKKMVSNEVMDKGVRVQPIDYFKALACLTYLCELKQDYSVCDNLVFLSKKIRETETEEVTDNRGSYLPLEVIVLEIGMKEKEEGTNYADPKILRTLKKTYESKKDACKIGTRQIDPYYESIGQMVNDMLSKENKKYSLKITNRTDLSALIFTDAILNTINDAANKLRIKKKLDTNDFFSASILSLKYIAEEASFKRFEDALTKEEEK